MIVLLRRISDDVNSGGSTTCPIQEIAPLTALRKKFAKSGFLFFVLVMLLSRGLPLALADLSRTAACGGANCVVEDEEGKAGA